MAAAAACRQAVFLDTPGIIVDKRNKLEDKMMASVQQVGLGWAGRGWAVGGVGGIAIREDRAL